MAQKGQELVAQSARHNNELETKRSKRSTSGRSTSAGVTLDDSKERITKAQKASFVTQDSKQSTVEFKQKAGEPKTGFRTPGPVSMESTKNAASHPAKRVGRTYSKQKAAEKVQSVSHLPTTKAQMLRSKSNKLLVKKQVVESLNNSTSM